MTIEQFSEDLDNIVDFTKQVAKASKIYIHGKLGWRISCLLFIRYFTSK